MADDISDENLCRICLSRDDLVSVFANIENESIYKLVKFAIDINITRQDAFPKHICSTCLEEIKVASYVKKKGKRTEVLLKDLVVAQNGDVAEEQVEFIEQTVDPDELEYMDIIEESPYAQPAIQKTKSKYLVYEEFPEHPTQPKFYYLPTPSSIKITNTEYFDYNQNLKTFVEDYLENKPNLEIIKIVNEGCIKEIESILKKNEKSLANSDTYTVDYMEEEEQIETPPSVSHTQPERTFPKQKPPTNFGINRSPPKSNNAGISKKLVIYPASSKSTTTTQVVHNVSRPQQNFPIYRLQPVNKKNGILKRN